MRSRTFLYQAAFLVAVGACQAQSRSGEIRSPAAAGTFYPGTAEELGSLVSGCLARSPDFGKLEPIALIAPHAGLLYSGGCAACGYGMLRGRQYDRVIVLGPSHYAGRLGGFRGAALPSYKAFRTPLGAVPIDTEAVRRLRDHPLFSFQPRCDRYEHSIEVQVPFLQEVLPGFNLLPVLFDAVKEKEYGQIAEALLPFVDKKTLVIASSDFTHFGRRFGFMPFVKGIRGRLQELDFGAITYIVNGEREKFLDYVRRTGATICGRTPIAVLLELMDRTSGSETVPARVLSYVTSADRTGATADSSMLRQGSVSYASIAFLRPGSVRVKGGEKVQPLDLLPNDKALDQTVRAQLLALARSTIRRHLAGEVKGRDYAAYVDMEKLAAVAKLRAGAFVTLKREGHLRGCIGSIYPHQPLWEAVVSNAINAAVNDRRFPNVELKELAALHIEISVLTPPREIAKPEEFQVGKQGIILEKNTRRAVFLPQVAPEQGWDRDETLNHLARKAGLPAEAWREGTRFWVFEAQVFGEK